MKFDIHVHTTLSPCSHLTVDDILSRAKDKGLDGVCITDHDTMAIRHHLSEGIQDNGLCLIFGMEYSSPDGDFLAFHRICFLAGDPGGDLLWWTAGIPGCAGG